MTKNQGSTRTWVLKIPLVLGAGIALAATGCGPDFDALCEERASCRGGNDMDVDACIEAYDAMAEHESDIGCTDEFDEFYQCYIDSASCQTEPSTTPCSNDDECHGSGQSCDGNVCVTRDYMLTDPTVCEAESNAYDSCSNWY